MSRQVIIPGQQAESTVFCSLCGIGDMDEKCLTMVRALKGAICRSCVRTATAVIEQQDLGVIATLAGRVDQLELRLRTIGGRAL